MARKEHKIPQPDRDYCVLAGKVKSRFSSKCKAKMYARDILPLHGAMTPYYCDMCQCWHLTHWSRKVSGQIQANENRKRKLIDLYNS